MNNNFQFQQINDLLERADNVLVASHETPDADAVGSVLAINAILKKLKINPFLYLPQLSSRPFVFLPGWFEIKTAIPQDANFDVLFGLDYGDFKRLGLSEHALNWEQNIGDIVTIDHHQGEQKGRIVVADTQASSTCEIIYWWLKENPPAGVEIDKEIALCLLTGIVADTGGFSHFSMSSKTFLAVSELLTYGMFLTNIINSTLLPKSNSFLESSAFLGRVLSRIKIIPKSELAYSWISAEEFARESFSNPNANLSGMASIIAKEPSINYALFLFEREKGKIRGSLRSEPFKGRRVDLIAKKMGGGGHPYAAGFSQEGTIEEVLKKVIDLIE